MANENQAKKESNNHSSINNAVALLLRAHSTSIDCMSAISFYIFCIDYHAIANSKIARNQNVTL